MSNSSAFVNRVVTTVVINRILFKIKPPRSFEALIPLLFSSKIPFSYLQSLLINTKSVHLEDNVIFIYLGDFIFEYDVPKLGTTLCRPAILYGERISGRVSPWVKEILAERTEPVCIGCIDMSNEDLAEVLVYPCVRSVKFEMFNDGFSELIQAQPHVTEVILNLMDSLFDFPAVEKVTLNMLSKFDTEDIIERLSPATKKLVIKISNELNSYSCGLLQFMKYFTLDLDELVFDTLFEFFYDSRTSTWLVDYAAATFFDDVEVISKMSKVKNLKIRLRYQWLFRDTRDLTRSFVDTAAEDLKLKKFRLIAFREHRECIFEALVGDKFRCTITFA